MVSSTVPRLDDRWPPVFETESIRKARSSVASCGKCLRSRRRRSAGLLMVSSRGSLATSVISELPVADEVGQLVQARRALAEDGQGIAGIGAQLVGVGAGVVEAEQADIGRLGG